MTDPLTPRGRAGVPAMDRAKSPGPMNAPSGSAPKTPRSTSRDSKLVHREDVDSGFLQTPVLAGLLSPQIDCLVV